MLWARKGPVGSNPTPSAGPIRRGRCCGPCQRGREEGLSIRRRALPVAAVLARAAVIIAPFVTSALVVFDVLVASAVPAVAPGAPSALATTVGPGWLVDVPHS